MCSLANRSGMQSRVGCVGGNRPGSRVEVYVIAQGGRSLNAQRVEVEDQKLMATLKTTKTKQHFKKKINKKYEQDREGGTGVTARQCLLSKLTTLGLGTFLSTLSFGAYFKKEEWWTRFRPCLPLGQGVTV